MFVNERPMYFSTTKRISAAFGAVFNSIYIRRYTNHTDSLYSNIQFTGLVTAGSTLVANVSRPISDILVGSTITGTGIATDTTVIESNQTLSALTLSKPATSTGTVTLTTNNVEREIKVPLDYAPSQKWLRMLDENRRRGTTKIQQSFPRMSYELTDIQYDQTRKLQTVNKYFAPKFGYYAELLRQLNPVPYDFSFNLNIAAKSMSDGLQIVEQILPNFTPSYTITVNDIPQMALRKDINIIFQSISKEDNFESDFEDDERYILWTLNFVVKGYLYPNIKDTGIINKVITNIYGDPQMTSTSKNTEIIAQPNPLDAQFDENWDVTLTIYDKDQLDDTGNPIITP